MTTDYDLFNMFDLLKAAKRNANFGTTPAQRARANQNETARFEAGGGTVGRRQEGAMTVPNPAKTQQVKVKPKVAKPKVVKPVTVDPNATSIDGKPKAKKPAVKKQPKAKKEKKVPKPKARSLSRRETITSQEGVDPTGARARAAYSGSVQGSRKRTSLSYKRRRAAARKLSAGATDASKYQARKLQNRLGVRGVGVPEKIVEKPKITKKKKKKVSSPLGKTACPLIKTELNGAFNNLLDNFQVLYK